MSKIDKEFFVDLIGKKRAPIGELFIERLVDEIVDNLRLTGSFTVPFLGTFKTKTYHPSEGSSREAYDRIVFVPTKTMRMKYNRTYVSEEEKAERRARKKIEARKRDKEKLRLKREQEAQEYLEQLALKKKKGKNKKETKEMQDDGETQIREENGDDC